ncbi:MAG: tetratricopeptide repeat protein [Prolixibacteraceae bacterium]|nr:tetratricopeptide repeat protein [Prolixibacteraceae bacterium]
MKKKAQIIFTGLLFTVISFISGAQNIDVNDLNLAGKYFQDGEFEKSGDLYLRLFETSRQPVYFTIFLNCMIELKDYERAEKEIKKQLRSSQRSPELYVQYGYILKLQNRYEEAVRNFEKAIEDVDRNKSSYNQLAGEFLNRGEFEYAEKVYMQGQQQLPDEKFHYELARTYMYQRNYDRMLDEYLKVLHIDENNLTNIQNNILSALSLDIDGSLNELFRVKLLKQIQSEPNLTVYNRLLIWFFVQEKQFANALRQQIALDKRTGTEDEFILNLADIAGRNKEYGEALKAYDYLLSKGVQAPVHIKTVKAKMNMYYNRFLDFEKSSPAEAEKLNVLFGECFSILGYSSESYKLMIDHAHLLAFYLNRPGQALDLLNNALKIQGLNPLQYSEIKMEIADLQVYKGDEWDAVLEYSQVIERNKTNTLGDEAKLKKARLSYYLGDFKWAQVQLDVIKASTSKMTSNDAFELSMLIGNNLNLDTTDIPMQMFARADLYLFRNQDSLALQVFDSIYTEFPKHNLHDEILFRKASICQKRGEYDKAAENLKIIVEENGYGLLADDALFLLAEIYQFHLNRKEEAQELYRKMLAEYPGSVYVTESRNRFRYLRGDPSSTEPAGGNSGS